MNPVRQNVKFDKKLIDKDALKVVKTLVKNGYEAYLVGGCIRDLLLGLQPKDFDIATSATPEQIHKVFKRSRIIGRRFKLVHIMFSARKYIEVATFRAGKVKTSNKGQVIRDNFYGSLKDDVFRRDFTVNALYYDVVKFQVIDYVNGLEDLKASQINIIGRASERFEEDPVRMIRAIRFKVKLEAELNPEISKNIKEIKKYAKVPTLAGFGIKSIEDAKLLSSHADGIIIGSSIVKMIEDSSDSKEFAKIGEYLSDIKKAIS